MKLRCRNRIKKIIICDGSMLNSIDPTQGFLFTFYKGRGNSPFLRKGTQGGGMPHDSITAIQLDMIVDVMNTANALKNMF